MLIYKSPLGPPLIPASPWPPNLNVCSSSIPDGTFTLILASFLILPSPLQFVQVCKIFLPLPRHSGHVDCVCMRPKIVFCSTTTVPVPWFRRTGPVRRSANWPTRSASCGELFRLNLSSPHRENDHYIQGNIRNFHKNSITKNKKVIPERILWTTKKTSGKE